MPLRALDHFFREIRVVRIRVPLVFLEFPLGHGVHLLTFFSFSTRRESMRGERLARGSSRSDVPTGTK